MQNGCVFCWKISLPKNWSLIENWRCRKSHFIFYSMASIWTVAFEAIIRCRLNFHFHSINAFSISVTTNGHIVMRPWHIVQNALTMFVVNFRFTFTLAILHLKFIFWWEKFHFKFLVHLGIFFSVLLHTYSSRIYPKIGKNGNENEIEK